MARLLLALALLLASVASADAAITFVGVTEANTTSVSLHASAAAGDLIVVSVCRTGSATAPTLDGGYTSITAGSAGSGGSAVAQRIGYRVMQGGDTTCGTWTNATQIVCLVVRGQKATGTPHGATPAVDANATRNVFRFGTLTMDVTNGTSWVAHMGCHRDATTANGETLSGATARGVGTAVNAGVWTAENVASWTSTDTSTMDTTNSARSVALELLAEQASGRRGTLLGVLP